MKVKIKVTQNGLGLPIPFKATEYSACLDLYAATREDLKLYPQSWISIPVGFCIEVPIGYEAQIRSRSGLSLRNGVFVLNSPATIDADYRGEIEVILCNIREIPFSISCGDRIAQMSIKKVEDFEFEVVEELSETNRGDGGFGSTGK